jgi:hypothetical protein
MVWSQKRYKLELQKENLLGGEISKIKRNKK